MNDSRNRVPAGSTSTHAPPPPRGVEFSQPALQAICAWVGAGYRAKYKPEKLGFLLGTVGPRGVVKVKRAALYKGGERTMFRATYDTASMLRSRAGVARKSRLRALGLFHSHVEVAGQAEYGLSWEDRVTFAEDEGAILEAVVFVRAADRKPVRTSKKVLFGFDREDGYAFNIRVYGKTARGIRLLPIRAAGMTKS